MLVVWRAQNRQQVMKTKGAALGSLYGVEGGEAFKERLSFQGYLLRSLERSFWGDDTHLYGLAKMFQVTITVLFWNKGGRGQFDERRVIHDRPMKDVDIVLVYDGSSHFHGTGRCFNFS